MTKLLFIKASPRGADSKSVAIAKACLAELDVLDAGLTVDTIDL